VSKFKESFSCFAGRCRKRGFNLQSAIVVDASPENGSVVIASPRWALVDGDPRPFLVWKGLDANAADVPLDLAEIRFLVERGRRHNSALGDNIACWILCDLVDAAPWGPAGNAFVGRFGIECYLAIQGRIVLRHGVLLSVEDAEQDREHSRRARRERAASYQRALAEGRRRVQLANTDGKFMFSWTPGQKGGFIAWGSAGGSEVTVSANGAGFEGFPGVSYRMSAADLTFREHKRAFRLAGLRPDTMGDNGHLVRVRGEWMRSSRRYGLGDKIPGIGIVQALGR